VSRPLGVDRLDARPQPDDTPTESWARAMFAAHAAFAAVPGLGGEGEPRWTEALLRSLGACGTTTCCRVRAYDGIAGAHEYRCRECWAAACSACAALYEEDDPPNVVCRACWRQAEAQRIGMTVPEPVEEL
jgi:hypothetical protein